MTTSETKESKTPNPIPNAGAMSDFIGAFDVPVGVAMKKKQEGWYEVSLRSTSEGKVHLGRTIAKISGKLGGSGGGHRKAAGCRVPIDKADEMIDALAKKV